MSLISVDQDIQRPTHPRLHIRDIRDAHIVLEAVRQGLLHPIKRRLNDLERSISIKSGSVFVWEESNDEMGLRRWTDSRLWSQSRMREPFLFYDERLPQEQEGPNDQSPTYRFIDGTCRGVPTPAVAHYDRSNHHPKGLVKQAYSAKVMLSPAAKVRKWHLTAYFSYEDLERIPTIDQDAMLQKVTVPAGVFRSGRARTRDTIMEQEHSQDTETPSSSPRSIDMTTGRRTILNPPGRVENQRPSLPPLQSISAHAYPYHNGHGTRTAEDQRIIRILNSRHVR